MAEDFVVARNPDPDSRLPYLIRLPLGPRGVVLKTRETWPRTSKVYCHRADDVPADLDIVERVPVRSCVRRGGAIDLVLERGRENRSQFVFTRIRGGREAIFWQSARTTKQARPNVSLPTARAAGVEKLEIFVDSHEKYAWTFSHQQATTTKRGLPAGDYAVELHGQVVAAVERKTLQDLVMTLTGGKLRFQLADLAALPHAVVVVEDRYSEVFKLERVRPAVVADGLAECQVRWSSVPIVFCENRSLAQEWAFRFLGAGLAAARDEEGGALLEATLPAARPLPPTVPTTAEVRRWALDHGLDVPRGGRLKPEIWALFEEHRLGLHG